MKNYDYPPNVQKQLEKIANLKLERPFDVEISPMIAALWALGFSTKSSCAGHQDRYGGGPLCIGELPDGRLLKRPSGTVTNPGST